MTTQTSPSNDNNTPNFMAHHTPEAAPEATAAEPVRQFPPGEPNE